MPATQPCSRSLVAVLAASITVQAIASAPSTTAWSAFGVMHAGGELGLVVRRREAVEAEHRVDARHGERDVRHVGRPGEPLRDLATGGRRTSGPAPRRSCGTARRGPCRARTRCTAARPSRRRRCSRSRARPPRSSASTLGSSSASCFRSLARTYHRPDVSCGTTFGASPPWVTMPWMRSVCLMCWRSRPIAVWATVSASAALTPELGVGRGVRGLAVVVHVELLDREARHVVEVVATTSGGPSSPRARRRTPPVGA